MFPQPRVTSSVPAGERMVATSIAVSTLSDFTVTMYSVTQKSAGLHAAPLSFTLAVAAAAAWTAAWSLVC